MDRGWRSVRSHGTESSGPRGPEHPPGGRGAPAPPGPELEPRASAVPVASQLRQAQGAVTRVVTHTWPHQPSCPGGLCDLPPPARTPRPHTTEEHPAQSHTVHFMLAHNSSGLRSPVNALPFLRSLFASLVFTLSSIFSFLPPHVPAASCAALALSSHLQGHSSLRLQIKGDQK